MRQALQRCVGDSTEETIAAAGRTSESALLPNRESGNLRGNIRNRRFEQPGHEAVTPQCSNFSAIYDASPPRQ